MIPRPLAPAPGPAYPRPVIVDVDHSPAPAFGLAEDLTPFRSEWHSHAKHQILYALSGALHLEVASGAWLLPPRRAALLVAGTRHLVRSERPVALRTVYLAEDLLPRPAWDCRVFSVSPLAREMLLYAMRWSHESPADDPLARPFFLALAALAAEWAEKDAYPFRLPAARSDELRRATEHALGRLGDPLAIEDLARAAGVSTRTLARRFADEMQSSFRGWLHTARMLRAMDLLAAPEARVTEVALEVGFESLSAFSASFSTFVGENPRDYRRRFSD